MKITYDELAELAKGLESSSIILREQLNNYNSEYTTSVLEFCNIVDSYSRYLLSTADLLRNTDEALKVIIEKNK